MTPLLITLILIIIFLFLGDVLEYFYSTRIKPKIAQLREKKNEKSR